MIEDLNRLDPEWAWSPYEPDAAEPWDRARAAHLFRRAGFGATGPQLAAAVEQQPAEVIRRWIEAGPEAEQFQQEIDDLADTVLAGGEAENLPAVWLYRMLGTPHQLLEKMTLFWHGHFATSAAKVEDPALMQQQNSLLRRHALGDFRQLVQGISRDSAMLVYLDSVTNRKSHPNENYARELMELFCLGEGNYTEKDVQELSRCFTGWEIRRGRYHFNRYQHDSKTKSLLGRRGKFTGEQAVDIVVDHPAAARFIAAKLFRWFICDEPAPPAALIEPLAKEFRRGELQIAGLVERILNSRLFFSNWAVGRKIRSPVELGVGLLRAVEGSTNVYQLGRQLKQLGQGLFYPPNVKGWDGGRAWVNSSTLLGRANLVQHLMTSDKTRFAGGTLVALARRNGARRPADQVDWLMGLMLAVPPSADARKQIVEVASAKQQDAEGRLKAVVHAISTLPEFQLG